MKNDMKKRILSAHLALILLLMLWCGTYFETKESQRQMEQLEASQSESGASNAVKVKRKLMYKAMHTPLGKYPETVTYTLGKIAGANNSNLPVGDTYENNAYTRYLKKILNIQNEKVVVVDNLETGFRKAVHPDAKFYQGDIRDRAFIDSVFEKEDIDGVIHFAANSQVGESMVNPLKYYNNNLCGTEVLLESMVAHGINKIVFSSTAATYGEPERIPILETDRTVPTNCYGETKLSMEKMFKWTANAHDLRFVSLRYFNACGAHPNGKIGEAHNPETHLIPLILQVPNGKREFISIFGDDYETKDGTCVRDYIHVNDLAQAHILAMEYLRKGNDSNIFNLGNGVGFTVKEVVETARKVTGHPIPAKEEPRRAGDPSTLIASSEKAKEILGWKPKFDDLETIITTAWNWHKNHPNGYEA